MADVTLTLKGDNKDLIKSLDEVQKKQQQVQDQARKGHKDEMGRIEELRLNIQKLTEARDKSTDITKIEAYNKRLKEEKEDLKELENAGVKANENIAKSTDKLSGVTGGLLKKLSLVGVAMAAITKVARDVVKTLKDTAAGMDSLTAAGELWKTLVYNLIKLNNDWGLSMSRALVAAKLINEERRNARANLIESARLQAEYNKLYFEASDRTLTDKDRLAKLNETMESHNRLIDKRVEKIQGELGIIIWQKSTRGDSNKLLDQEAKLVAELITLEGERYSQTKRIQMQRSILEKEIAERERKEMFDRYYAEIEANNEAYDEMMRKKEEFKDLSEKLIDDLERAEIDSLTGADKLAAQRDYELKALEQFRNHMKQYGMLTQEQESMFVALGQKVWEAFYKGLKDESADTAEDYEKWLKDHFMDILDFTSKQNKELEKELNWIYGKIDELNKRDEKSAEERKEFYISSTRDTVDSVVDMLDDIYSQRLADAQRTREIYDTQIGELQRDIDIELELKKAGYASNLSAKQEELAQIKAARDKALREEEAALKKQRDMQLLSQSLSLATSAAKLIQAGIEEGGLYGLVLAGIEVAAMFIAWDQYKQQAKNSTRLGKGGSGTDTGMVTGKSHAAGGERFTDQIEVERGEAWGVLSVPATQKYGKIFHEMVSSFNKGEIPTVVPAPMVNNKVLVDNNGSNSRLDQLIRENRKLNDKLSKESIQDTGNARIIRKNDNIRIIRK